MKKIEKVRPVVIVKVCSGALLFNAMKKNVLSLCRIGVINN
jgi:hypothetical protein